MAVLLENILERIDRIEKQLNITSNHTLKTENTGRDKSIQAQGMYYLSLIVRKPVFRVSDQVPHKLGCTATEDG